MEEILAGAAGGKLQPAELMDLTEKVFEDEKQPFQVLNRNGNKVTIRLEDGRTKEYTL